MCSILIGCASPTWSSSPVRCTTNGHKTSFNSSGSRQKKGSTRETRRVEILHSVHHAVLYRATEIIRLHSQRFATVVFSLVSFLLLLNSSYKLHHQSSRKMGDKYVVVSSVAVVVTVAVDGGWWRKINIRQVFSVLH